MRPEVSVVVPVRNEAKYIEACVLRLLEQDYPPHLIELLVVDGASDDGTPDVVRDLQQRNPRARLRLLHNEHRTIPHALNIGIRAARSAIVIRMDGHTVPERDYVSACVRALTTSGAANVGGYLTSRGDTPFGMAVAVATAHRLGMGNARYRMGGMAGDVDTVPFGAFRREAFERVGLFDESMACNEDYEMNARIRAAGERVFFDDAIRFTYTPRGTVGSLWHQYFRYGWWRVETLRRHPRSLRLRQAIPPAFVASVVATALLSLWWQSATGALAVLAFVYLALVGTVSTRLVRDGTDLGRIMLAFVVLHVAYGLGFLVNAITQGTYPYRAGPPRVPEFGRTEAQG